MGTPHPQFYLLGVTDVATNTKSKAFWFQVSFNHPSNPLR